MKALFALLLTCTLAFSQSDYLRLREKPPAGKPPAGFVDIYNDSATGTLKYRNSAGTVSLVTSTKSSIGLGNVDNTSDANKPVSTATQTALDSKAPASATQTALDRLGASNFYAAAYGVIADGVTDDTVALQNCINAAAAAGTNSRRATVVLPRGVIMLGRTTMANPTSNPTWKFALRMYSNVNLVGQGMDVTTLRIITGTVGDTPVIDAVGEYRGAAVTTNGSANVTVSSTSGLHVGMKIAGTGVPFNSGIASITNGTTLVMTDNATATATAPMEFGPVNMSFEGFTSDPNTWVRFGTSPVGEGEAINLKGARRVSFRDVRVCNAEQDGFDLDGGSNFLFEGCIAEDNWGSGLHMVADGVERVLVNGCFFRRNGFGRRASSEGGGGVGANGAGIDCMSGFLFVNGCMFENNAIETHLLAGYMNLTGCGIYHYPASTLYPSTNTLPAMLAGWTALGAVGSGAMEINNCVANAVGSTKVIEVLQTWPQLFVRNSLVYGLVSITAGKDVYWNNNYLNPGGGSTNAFTVVAATGRVHILNSRFEDYGNALRFDNASNGVISGCSFNGGGGARDIHFTISSAKSGWSVINNVLSSAASQAIYTSSGFTASTFANNVGTTTAGFVMYLGGGGSSQNNIIRNNSISNLTVDSGASTGNLFEDNYITGTISHPSTTTFASNTWRRNTGAGCAGIFYGTATLTSGAATLTSPAANSSRKWSLTRQAKNASTAIGSLSLGTVTAQTNFIINALKSDATTETGDASTVYWEINE